MEQGMNVRVLNEQEKCELISALANARVNNNKKAKVFKTAAQDAHHREDAADFSATAERFELWAQLDESLIEAIRENKIVIFDEDAEV
ncbi:MAG: hypothetical protein E7649_06205 [Ruminococcaceae bacterium]|nr:hypothetical protein [Oscillospiraceae bacterium]